MQGVNLHRRAKQLQPFIVTSARIGYLAKGLVFLSLGLFTARAALSAGQLPDGLKGALADWANELYGQLLLGALAVGLMGYVLWLLCRAVLDADHLGRTPLALLQRAGALTSAGGFLLLVVFAVQVAWQGWGQGDGAGPQRWVAFFLALPLGPWLVALAGLCLIGVMVNHALVALSGLFLQTIDVSGPPHWKNAVLTFTGRWGLLARGSVFGLVGVTLVRAGWRQDAQGAGGIGAALRAVARGDAGGWWLGLLAFGLVSLAVFSGLQAWYRRVDLRWDSSDSARGGRDAQPD